MKNTKKNQEKWIEKVKDTLILGGRSDRTFSNYKSHIIRFLKYYDEEINISKLSNDDIVDYFKKKYINLNRCAETLNVGIYSVRFLYSVCFNKKLNKDILPSTKIKKVMPTIMNKKTFIKIINDDKNLKHKCWLLLSFCSGLRVEEVATIKIENIFSNEHKLKVLGKGNKERYTILPDITIKFLRMYYKSKKLKETSGYLFKGTNGNEHINSKTIINYFTQIQNKYNLGKNVTFHSLRHSFATYYLSNGGSLLTLQSMMGHKSLNSTIIYLHLSHNFNELEGIKYV